MRAAWLVKVMNMKYKKESRAAVQLPVVAPPGREMVHGTRLRRFALGVPTAKTINGEKILEGVAMCRQTNMRPYSIDLDRHEDRSIVADTRQASSTAPLVIEHRETGSNKPILTRDSLNEIFPVHI